MFPPKAPMPMGSNMPFGRTPLPNPKADLNAKKKKKYNSIEGLKSAAGMNTSVPPQREQ